MNILITSAGRRVSLVRAFQKEIKKLDPNGKVIAADAKPHLSAACQVADGNFMVPLINSNDYLDVLLQYCVDLKVDLIIPTIDTELMMLAKGKHKFDNVGVQLVISSVDFIKKCRDKRLTHKLFNSLGISTAREFSKTSYEFPLFIKPRNGSSSVDNYIIRNANELNSYHMDNENLMFLEYLDQEIYDEYTCDTYYSKDNFLRCVVPRKRIAIRDGEVNKGITVNNELVQFIETHMKYLEGAVGCLTTQFFKNEGKIYGIEINPRFGGGFPLTYLSGANFPKWIIREYLLNESISDQFNCWEDNLLMLRYDDEILVRGYKGKS